jgi:hypothetical protein
MTTNGCDDNHVLQWILSDDFTQTGCRCMGAEVLMLTWL